MDKDKDMSRRRFLKMAALTEVIPPIAAATIAAYINSFFIVFKFNCF